MNKAYLCSTFFGYRSHANSGSSTTAQASVQTLNPSVVFLETKNVILTNSLVRRNKFWFGFIRERNCDSKINFLRVQKQKSEFKSFSELKQVEILLT